MKNLLPVLFFLFLPCFSTGCVHRVFRTLDAAPEALPPAMAKDIVIEREIIDYECRTNTVEEMQIVNVRVQAAYGTGNDYRSNSIDLVCYYPQRKGLLPVVLILPISGGGYFLEESFAEDLYDHGIASVIVKREKNREIESVERINELLYRSVLDNMTVIDWICSRGVYDTNKLGVLGTSMGSIKAVLLTAADKRINAAVLGLVGGDLPYIITHSTEGSWRHGGIYKARKEILKKENISLEQFYDNLKKGIVWDPKNVAPCIDPKKVLIINGCLDTVVAAKKGRELRHLMGDPETIYLFSGHYGALAYIRYIKSQTRKFFEDHLDITEN